MSFRFSTSPVLKSDTVLKLEQSGKISLLLEAIEDERKNVGSNTGSSKNGQVTVRRVGSYGGKKGR